jgi:hypothetical protein
MADQPDASLAANIRKFLMKAFNSEEIEGLCFDNFSEVQDNFTPAMSKSDRVLRLVDYCQRRRSIPRLLEILRNERESLYEQYFGRLEPASPTRSPAGAATPSARHSSSRIEILESERETMQVRFLVRTTGQRYTIAIPFDGFVKDVVPEIAEKVGLPLRFENGKPVPYEVYSESREVTLDEEKTFRQNGVQEGERLSFYVHYGAK